MMFHFISDGYAPLWILSTVLMPINHAFVIYAVLPPISVLFLFHPPLPSLHSFFSTLSLTSGKKALGNVTII